MVKPPVIVDGQFLCYRAFHSMKFMGMESPFVIAGFLKEIGQLRRRFSTDFFIFCWDHQNCRRKKLCPEYKDKTQKPDPTRAVLHKQIRKIRDEIIPRLGFVNNLQADGYEGDDMIACAVRSLRLQSLAGNTVIVSGDHDLYQLLSKQVVMYNPINKKVTTVDSIRQKYNVTPQQWVFVKAIAGCSSDNIAGVPGVGEATAIKFVRGELPSGSIYRRIFELRDVIERNLSLVKLPMHGCPDRHVSLQGEIPATYWSAIDVGANPFDVLKSDKPKTRTRNGWKENPWTRRYHAG